jgi:hypothetical protein
MVYRIAGFVRQDSCNAVVDSLDNGTIEIYTLAPPNDLSNTRTTGVLLGTLTFGTTAFGNANTSGTATANTITDDTSADASGTAGHFVLVTSGNTIHSDGSCGGTGSSADMIFNNTVIVEGGIIHISSMTVTVPEKLSS